jgi:hypothetical protein
MMMLLLLCLDLHATVNNTPKRWDIHPDAQHGPTNHHHNRVENTEAIVVV